MCSVLCVSVYTCLILFFFLLRYILDNFHHHIFQVTNHCVCSVSCVGCIFFMSDTLVLISRNLICFIYIFHVPTYKCSLSTSLWDAYVTKVPWPFLFSSGIHIYNTYAVLCDDVPQSATFSSLFLLLFFFLILFLLLNFLLLSLNNFQSPVFKCADSFLWLVKS